MSQNEILVSYHIETYWVEKRIEKLTHSLKEYVQIRVISLIISIVNVPHKNIPLFTCMWIL